MTPPLLKLPTVVFVWGQGLISLKIAQISSSQMTISTRFFKALRKEEKYLIT